VLDLLDLVHHQSVDLLVAGDNDFFLRADNSKDIPFPRDYMRLPDLVDLHEVVDYFLFVPGNNLEEDECFLIDRQRKEAAFDCF
jgi:hypothetical protein